MAMIYYQLRELRRTSFIIMYFNFSQRRLRLLGHVLRMGDEQILKSSMNGELVVGKRNLKILNIKTDELELLASDRATWQSTVHISLK